MQKKKIIFRIMGLFALLFWGWISPGLAQQGVDYSGVHIVQPGESLYGISDKYGMDVVTLKSINKLNSNSISAGQRLAVRRLDNSTPGVMGRTVEGGYVLQQQSPGFQARSVGDPVPQMETHPDHAPDEMVVERVKYYQVMKGEDIYDVSQKFSVSLEQLESWNGSTYVKAGEVLIVKKWYEHLNTAGMDNDDFSEFVHGSQEQTEARDPYKKQVATVNQQEPVSMASTLRNMDAVEVPSTNSGDGQFQARGFAYPPEKVSVLASVEEIGLLGSHIQSGKFVRFEQDSVESQFYAKHETIPVGTYVYLSLPNNPGYIKVEIVGKLQTQTSAFIALSPALVNLIRGSGSKEDVVTIVFD